MKTTVTAIKTIEDVAGKMYNGKMMPAQKRIVWNDETGRNISGWVNINLFDAKEWVVGGKPDVEIYQSADGKFWNFKMSTPTTKAAAQTTQGIAQVLALCTEMNERLKHIEGKVLPVAVNSTHPFES